MPQRLLTILILLICPLYLFSQNKESEKRFAVSNIPQDLKIGVDEIFRVDEMNFAISAEDRAVLHINQAVTILNQDGDNKALLWIPYDDFRKVKNIAGQTYDENGVELNKLKKSDIIDRSYISGDSFVEDSRIKAADMTETKYPYTVNFEYDIEYEGLFYYPTWIALNGEEMSSEGSIFTVTFLPDLKPRFKEMNFDRGFDISTDHGPTQLRWVIGQIKPIDREPYSKGLSEQIPYVLIGPTTFSLDGYRGTMNSWDEFGEWYFSLNKDRDDLQPSTITKLQEIISDAENDIEKVKRVYEFMQSKTRYVSIQLGIGGWQTFPASFVDEKGWGDCKALSNYTYALLKAAGIESNLVLIQAGGVSKFDPDFPSNQFNHVILNVPMGKDTIWLECTSQNAPFGYLGTFTGGRQALMIKDHGSSIVRTPSFSMLENIQSTVADVFLDKEGNARAQVITQYEGTEFENDGINFMIHKSADEQKKWLYNRIQLTNFTISDFSFTEIKNFNPKITENLDLDIKNYAKISGKRIFVELNLLNKRSYIPKEIKERKTDVNIQNGYIHIDTIRYHLPVGIHPEHVPENQDIESLFGEFNVRVIVESGIVTYIRKLKMPKHVYPAGTYVDLVEFYKQISRADKSRIVFLKPT